MERKICLNTPQEAEIQCGVPHLCGVLGLFFRKASNPLRKIACGVPHDAEFCMMLNSA